MGGGGSLQSVVIYPLARSSAVGQSVMSAVGRGFGSFGSSLATIVPTKETFALLGDIPKETKGFREAHAERSER